METLSLHATLNLINLVAMATPGASRCVLEETGEGREIAHSSVEMILFWANPKLNQLNL
jgi:hypothetical protein